ncbi:MAG: acyl-CoA synthetase [Comamonadaceae bacterium]|nr:MAG: acyl-CoA synthetase [Comamonadaceae bacterium]
MEPDAGAGVSEPAPHGRSRRGDAPAGRPAAGDAAADWASTPERSNMLALRAICWIAIRCGRPLARLVLWPICLYFLLFSPTQRRHIKRYLYRAVGPGAGWGDGFRLLHAFASTVLDRVFFLRGRLDLFDIRVQGTQPVVEEAVAGRGAFMLGAHVGSFEALGACLGAGPDHPPLRAAMLMYPDNARQINAVLDAVSLPGLRPTVIALGRPGSMLALRDWLDAGGMAGMLADRTLPAGESSGGERRGNSLSIRFLGQPALFNDGPFRLAALLRRRVFFMAGLYAGGARYDVLFEPLADFSERASSVEARETQIRLAVEAYVARLESLCRTYPYNWFNFHDFWLEDAQ